MLNYLAPFVDIATYRKLNIYNLLYLSANLDLAVHMKTLNSMQYIKDEITLELMCGNLHSSKDVLSKYNKLASLW